MKVHSSDDALFSYRSFTLLRHKDVAHGFFTRIGGVSEEPYFSSLNCNFSSADQKANILQNQKLICDSLGFQSENLKVIKQVHSKHVVTILDEKFNSISSQGDSLVTNIPGLVLGIQTADCVPIIFYEPQNKVIGAAHAGWKGAKGGIIENTINAMQQLGAQTPSIIASVGPCIQQYSYEVDEKFYQEFIGQEFNNEIFFIRSEKKGHYKFDLPGFCVYKLRKLGILKIENLGIDTYSNASVLFSYRRECHENLDSKSLKYGCQLSVIGLKK